MRFIIQRRFRLSHENRFADTVEIARSGFDQACWWQDNSFSSTVPSTFEPANDLIGHYTGEAGYDIDIQEFEDGLKLMFSKKSASTPPLQFRVDRQDNGRKLTILHDDPIKLGIDVFLAPMNMSLDVRDIGNNGVELIRWGLSFRTVFRKTIQDSEPL